MRRLRSAVEIVSEIGALGFDLQHHRAEDIAGAVAFLRTVNAPMFDWLLQALAQPASVDALDPSATDPGTLPTRD